MFKEKPKLEILGACLNPAGKDLPSADKTGEHLSLTVNDRAVAGYTVEQLVKSHGQAEHMAVLHRFATDLPLGVKRVVLRSGTSTNRQDGDVLNVYLGQHGSGRWLLNNDGELIRVKDLQGRVVDERRFGANHCDPVPIRGAAGGVVAAAAFGAVR